MSIVGCGWYGWPLAHRLLALGWDVKGSKTTERGVRALSADGVEGHRLRLDPGPSHPVPEALLEADVLVVNIPPQRRRDVGRYHLEQMQALGDMVTGSPVRNVLLISSTSVYPNVNRKVTELDRLTPDKPSGRALLRVEEFWRAHVQVETTVLRFGGLAGGDRDPGRFLAGRTGVANADAPVNLIHLEDCLSITVAILEQGAWGEIFNACCPRHPTRRVFYRAAALRAGLEPPTFAEAPTTAFKEVDSGLLLRRLGYRFHYPDPLDFP